MKNEKTQYALSVCKPELQQKKNRPYLVFADSFTGLVRKRNEDSYVYAWNTDCRQLLTGVADGIGSTVNGDIAGNYTLQLLVRAWRRFQIPKENSDQLVGDFLFNTVRDINRRLYEINSLGSCPGRDSLGTTLAAAVFMKKKMVAVNAGDSPIFRIRGDLIQQLTHDHNLSSELVRMKQISRDEAATLDRGRMLTRFIGPGENLEPECYVSDVFPEDCFVLCSDGLTLHLPLEEIGQIICEFKDNPAKAMKVMLCRAIQRGAMDNVTVILVKAL